VSAGWKAVVIESGAHVDRFLLERLAAKAPVFVIEPFACHHKSRGTIPKFPRPFPLFLERQIRSGRVGLIPVSALDDRTLYGTAAEKAVQAVEQVFPAYRQRYSVMIDCLCRLLGSPKVEYIFKKTLCFRLAEFYSQNLVIERVRRHLGSGPILFFPDADVLSYEEIRALVSQSGEGTYPDSDIYFPLRSRLISRIERGIRSLSSLGLLAAQAFASNLFGRRPPQPEQEKEEFRYAVAVTGPRQFADNRRGPNFIIDGSVIRDADVAFVPTFTLSKAQKQSLRRQRCRIIYPPAQGKFFSDPAAWNRLLNAALKQSPFCGAEEIKAASTALFHFLAWSRLLERFSFHHFITHCDFAVGHIGRNLALKKQSVRTWYFTDSMNIGPDTTDREKRRHPYWTYLLYDEFVTWCGLCADFFLSHPGTAMTPHIVGCLWAEHAAAGTTASSRREFTLGVFDSTYSLKGMACYEEGIAFAQHILALADATPGIRIVFKEKKERDIHRLFDPSMSPKLISLYEKLASHPRIKILSSNADSSELIASVDAVASFPFTSTTFEAYSIGKPAFWHDPLGCYHESPYSRFPGMLTHGLDELIRETNRLRGNSSRNRAQIPPDSPMMDPYLDGKAIGRFIRLLAEDQAEELPTALLPERTGRSGGWPQAQPSSR
jgi:hypothetical protein